MPLSLLVKHHLTARLFQHIFLCSLHEAKGAAPPLPHSVYLCCLLTLFHQRGHAQEARHHFQEQLEHRAGKIRVVSSRQVTPEYTYFTQPNMMYLHV